MLSCSRSPSGTFGCGFPTVNGVTAAALSALIASLKPQAPVTNHLSRHVRIAAPCDCYSWAACPSLHFIFDSKSKTNTVSFLAVLLCGMQFAQREMRCRKTGLRRVYDVRIMDGFVVQRRR